jgi:hypothetical protein
MGQPRPGGCLLRGTCRARSWTSSSSRDNPDEWVYNDYNPNILGLAHQRATGALLMDQPIRRPLSEISTEDPVAGCVGDQGFRHHESGLVSSPRDLAKIGTYALAHPRPPGPPTRCLKASDTGTGGGSSAATSSLSESTRRT